MKPDFIRAVKEFMGEAGGHPDVIPIEKPAAPTPANAGAKKTATVNTDGLNMREFSSASSAVVGVLSKGTKVQVNRTAMNGETSWTSIVASGQWGWVNSRYLTAA